MNQMLIHKTSTKTIALVCLLLLVQTSLVPAADDITGVWEITTDYNGFQSLATLFISKKANGTLTGKWGSRELSEVKFQKGKLTFVRTLRFGNREFSTDYSGTLKDGKLTGTMSSDRGDWAVNGSRKKPKCPALGQWDMKFNIGKREITGKLTISGKPDGMMAGKWDAEYGEHTISNVKFEDGKLSYARKSKINDFEFESTFEGTVEGHKLAGVFKSQRGEMLATGARKGAALVGNWELTSTSDRGTFTSMLMIDGDLTGRYELFGGEIPIKNLKLEGDQVTFGIEMGRGDRTYTMNFKGTLDVKSLTGQFTSGRGTREVTGRWIQAASSVKRELKVYSKPPNATVFYRRHGDREYGPPHHEPTNTGIILEYACWYLKVEKEGYKPQEKFFDPYRTNIWRVDFVLQPVK